MKQRDLILGLGFLSAFAMQAQSPYTGSATPSEAASFYMYQVESGKWLQNNQRVSGDWTTRAQLDKDGFDVELIPIEDVENGYRINPKNNGNNSLNASNFYTDTSDAQTTWIITPTTVDGVSNAYTIQAPDGWLLGENNGDLSSSANGTTWQFVTREERLTKMQADAANGAVDATWLIPGHDMSRVDSRNDLWTLRYVSNAGNVTIDGLQQNSVREAWHQNVGYVHYITLTDLPNGTYNFTVQGYYRDTEIESEECQQRIADGEPIQRAHYFAGAADGLIMPISQGAPTEEVSDRYTYQTTTVWVPNSLANASYAFMDGDYTNPWLTAVVTDGTLTIGVYKPESAYRDWLVYDNFQLQYVSAETPAVDTTALKADINKWLEESESLPTTVAITEAREDGLYAVEEDDATVSDMREAQMDLIAIVAAVDASSDPINYFLDTLELARKEGADTSEAVDAFNVAETKDQFNSALNTLRYARRRANADTYEDEFEGNAPEAGEFYLYNVGQGQFLCGGSDWGAHAALGFPGIVITLEEESAEDLTFHFDTGLFNGDSSHYMNYRGYLDCGKAGAWKFLPVEGMEGVYNIVQNDYQDAYVAYNPNASVDQGNGDETTVGTENRGNFDPTNPDQQWKLVTRAEREALLQEASIDNPTDATFYIASPNFNQRENASSVWTMTNASIWEYGSNHNDFVAESWNTDNCDINQMVEGLPAGIYTLSVQGFYRNGRHNTTDRGTEDEVTGQPDLDFTQNAFLYANDDEAALANITAESFKAPGEGDNTESADGVIYNIPNSCVQAANFFRSGLYRQHVSVEVDGDLVLGVYKDEAGEPEDWVVVDNFRLTYWGNETTVEAVEQAIADGITPTFTDAPAYQGDGFIYNLQGIRVDNPSTGIYIQNGKKFVVK
jgi:hypothetical protein